MTTAAPTVADPGPDRTAPFLANPLGEALCIAVSAVSYFIAIRFIDQWPFALLAPLPMLAAAFAAPSRRRAAVCAFVPIFVGEFGLWSAESFFLPLPLFVVIAVVSGLVVAALVLVARTVARESNHWSAALVFPILYAALNFVFSRIQADGTWASPAYRMDSFLPLLQIASIAGLWGVIFSMSLPASAFAFAWYRAEASRPWRVPVRVALGIFALVFLFGLGRLAIASKLPTVRVAMIASDHEIKYSRTTDASQAADLLNFYLGQIPQAVAQGAQVVVLPEKIVGVTPDDRAELVRMLSDAASSSHVWLVAGVNEIGRTPKTNAAWIFLPNGALSEYHKHYFVRGFENGYQSGKGIYAISAPWGKVGVAICKDLDYPWFIRGYGAQDVRLMLVPAWDWEGPNAVLHERMAFVRGVENGFAMARSAKTGFVTAHDAYGHTIASSSTFAKDPAIIVADVPLGPGSTLYSEFGEWFGWLCLAASLLILVMVFRFRPSRPV
jgi:apolipoprotein N-acyltransferase